MRKSPLVLAGLTIVQACAIFMPVALIYPNIRNTMVEPAAWIAVAAAATLFLRMVFDPQIQRDVQAINFERRDQRRAQGRIGIFDPRWGLFGSITGDNVLLFTHTIAMAEFLLALVFSRQLEGRFLLLVGATFFAAIELSILHGVRIYAAARSQE
jgi:hypothetical protein